MKAKLLLLFGCLCFVLVGCYPSCCASPDPISNSQWLKEQEQKIRKHEQLVSKYCRNNEPVSSQLQAEYKIEYLNEETCGCFEKKLNHYKAEAVWIQGEIDERGADASNYYKKRNKAFLEWDRNNPVAHCKYELSHSLWIDVENP